MELVAQVQVICTCTRGKVVKWTMYIGVDLHCKFTLLHDLRSKKHIENQASLFIVHADADSSRGSLQGLRCFCFFQYFLELKIGCHCLSGAIRGGDFCHFCKDLHFGGTNAFELFWSPGYLVQAPIHFIGLIGHQLTFILVVALAVFTE